MKRPTLSVARSLYPGFGRTWLGVPGALLAVALGSSQLAAQQVSGTLRQLDTGAPAAGVVVAALLATTDSVVGRTITGARGTYLLRLPPAEVVLRVLRVGQQPFELARVTLAPGERREVSAELPNIPVRLATFDARVDTRCRVNPVDGTLVAQLFDEARKALWASRLAASERPATAVISQVVQQFDARERPRGEPRVNQSTPASLQPFSSVDVDSLLERGFRVITPDDAMIYRAPDAEVLTADRFLADYCLRLNTDSISYPEWIGVSFEPARARRGVVQVRGTLWLDRQSQELRRIDYGYSGLEPMLARATPGGVVEYTLLPNGVWFVDAWSIRMPRVLRITRLTPNGQELDNATLNGVQVTSGRVRELRADGDLLFTSGVDSVGAFAGDLVSPLVSLRDETECDTLAADTLVNVSGVLRDSLGQPLAGVLVRATWTVRFNPGISNQFDRYEGRETFTHTGVDGRFDLCDVPRERPVNIVAGASGQVMARTTMRLRRGAMPGVMELIGRPAETRRSLL